MSELPKNQEGRMASAGFSRRVAALAWDLPVIAGWAALAGVIGVGLNGLAGSQQRPPWMLDLQAFLTLVLPVMLTFTYLEGSASHATFGKRRMRLMVTDASGRPPGFRRALVRSVVKLLPWQLGHTAVFHLMAGSTSVAFIALSIGAQGLVVASLLVTLRDGQHRALHDWVAGTRVVDAP